MSRFATGFHLLSRLASATGGLPAKMSRLATGFHLLSRLALATGGAAREDEPVCNRLPPSEPVGFSHRRGCPRDELSYWHIRRVVLSWPLHQTMTD